MTLMAMHIMLLLVIFALLLTAMPIHIRHTRRHAACLLHQRSLLAIWDTKAVNTHIPLVPDILIVRVYIILRQLIHMDTGIVLYKYINTNETNLLNKLTSKRYYTCTNSATCGYKTSSSGNQYYVQLGNFCSTTNCNSNSGSTYTSTCSEAALLKSFVNLFHALIFTSIMMVF